MSILLAISRDHLARTMGPVKKDFLFIQGIVAKKSRVERNFIDSRAEESVVYSDDLDL